jgi:hypothetical protein
MTPKIEAFLKALTQLSLDHGVFIRGCGCCGSPWVEANDKSSGRYTVAKGGDHLTWETFT